MLTPSADTSTVDVLATFCANGRTIPTPKQSTWTLDVEMFQDPQGRRRRRWARRVHVRQRRQRGVLHARAERHELPPRAIGRVRMSPTAFGGAARTPLTATASWPVTQWPSIAWGLTLAATMSTTSTDKADKADKPKASA